MSTDVAIKHIAIPSIRNMKEDDAGGGNGGGRNELKLKRKSEESIPTEIGGKKMKKQWKKTIRRKKLIKWKKNSKKPRSLDGDHPSTDSKKVTTTTTVAPSSGGTGKRRRRMTESFNAPFNSTQFLMNDHKTEAVRHLDSTLNGGNNAGGRKNEVNVDDDDSVDITMEERPLRRITRARESSFSIDSDDDYYYSSPEDEEEFMSREFIKDYDNLRNDRLIDMSKDELINEYLQMEEKIEALEKRLSRQSSTTDNVAETATDKNKNENQDDTNSKEAMANTILKFQKEIQRLESENDQLKLKSIQNTTVHPGCSSSCSSSSESDDSESDSDSDSDDSSESDSDNEEREMQISSKQVITGEKKLSIKAAAEKGLKIDCEVEGDTGYESGQSNKPVHSVNEIGINPNEEKEVVVNGNLTENLQKDEIDNSDNLESETESCPELISVNCITSTSP